MAVAIALLPDGVAVIEWQAIQCDSDYLYRSSE
ncbi:hypothetical protein CJA_3058 [Cellvibrio japonicus Ueda107]|uniref:Uncharacterized protein n=1 Tax=Cellvibrio japonicus (strain Ueda107) TaxID=498211 RepID=B3PDA0_CELJU|nr:hypothetical protein CJA_3058 [Cellvibrio japonicus Ueda107]